ncbi:alpha/beta fold hydrolase [Brachybacterium sp. GPGPB12]|uniref:alpha/beta fold hydrolase n=1 Tax=Brachybacterium sp. GPGPB12 TaxID=3023517 RepID=UPI003134357F
MKSTPGIPDVPGLDPVPHRTEQVRDHTGEPRQWHLLDSGPWLAERGITPRGTLLAVHGNPTWSFLFRSLVREDIPWRLIAVDQLEMGYSERTGVTRRYQDRITDLSLLTDALSLHGPVVTVGHDWGGLISTGWALDNRHDVVGMILTNTGVHQRIEEARRRRCAARDHPRLPHRLDLADRRLPAHHPVAVEAVAAQGDPGRLSRALPLPLAPPRHRPVRRRHPRRRGPPLPRHPRPGRRGAHPPPGPHALRLGPARHHLLGPLPARPDPARPARGRAPLRGRLPPGVGGRRRRRPRRPVARGELRHRRHAPHRGPGPAPRLLLRRRAGARRPDRRADRAPGRGSGARPSSGRGRARRRGGRRHAGDLLVAACTAASRTSPRACSATGSAPATGSAC